MHIHSKKKKKRIEELIESKKIPSQKKKKKNLKGDILRNLLLEKVNHFDEIFCGIDLLSKLQAIKSF